jgi:hypothetical protein
MKRITINLTNEEYIKLEMLRGRNDRSRYLGKVISNLPEEPKEDTEQFKKTIRQMNYMKHMIHILKLKETERKEI